MASTTLLLAGAALLAAAAALRPAQAQPAKEICSDKAPSGRFSEGTTKWDMYRFVAGDREQHEARAAAQAAARTASVPAPSVEGRTTAHARLHPRR